MYEMSKTSYNLGWREYISHSYQCFFFE